MLRHLNALLFDKCVRDKWSYDQLPLVQRIMNTAEKSSTGLIPAELILNNSIRLSERIETQASAQGTKSQVALSDRIDEWVARQYDLI